MKRLFLVLVMAIVFVLTLTVAVSAESAHNGKVDLNQKVTLSDGTECALFDADGDALIWYKDANGALQSIKAQDERVKYNGSYDFGVGDNTVGKIQAYEVNKIEIALESGTLGCGNIVVFNIMDDDVLTNTGSRLNKPVNCIRSTTFSNSKNVEYAFLRLDTVAIQAEAFKGCSNLKYVNLEHLTELRQFGGGSCFNNCTSLFAGEVLDLSNTKLCAVGGTGTFNAVPFTGVILPNTVTDLGEWNFQATAITSFTVPAGVTNLRNCSFRNCKSLTTICFGPNVTSMDDNIFLETTGITTINFVGTESEFAAISSKPAISKLNASVNYNYNYCEAYYNGNHELDPEKSNDCAGICGKCGEVALSANPIHNYVTTISYAKGYLNTGIKTETCQNAGCAHENGYESVVEAIATFNGVSVKINGDGLTFGFTFNYEALDELVKITGKSVELGFVVGVKDFIEGEAYNNKNAVTASVLTWIVETEEEKNEVKYASADFVLRGTWDRMVDLDGDMIAETNVKDVEFYMAGYLVTNNTVSYLNASDNFTSPGVVTYNGCNQ
ncbi:MAG: leucine-rich repeat domain-containing protein [Clostridia bacterium]|nr:leucine-rich repeat domain-containing protein [Clostridia bacterium]